MSEFKKPKVNPDARTTIFSWKWMADTVEECKELTTCIGWTCLCEQFGVSSLMAGPGREKKTEPETKIIKERRGPTRWVGGHHEQGYCEPQRRLRRGVKRCWPVSRSGGKEAIGNREDINLLLTLWYAEERGICGNTFSELNGFQ